MMKRSWTRDRVLVGSAVLALVIIVPLAVLFLVSTAYWVDAKLADVSGSHAAASVRTRDVEPGDEVYIQTWAVGRKGNVNYANGRLLVVRDGNELRSVPFPASGANPTVTLPSDLRLGDKVSVILNVTEPRGLAAHTARTFRNGSTWMFRSHLPLSLARPSTGASPRSAG